MSFVVASVRSRRIERTIGPPRSCATIITSMIRSEVGWARSALTDSSAGTTPIARDRLENRAKAARKGSRTRQGELFECPSRRTFPMRLMRRDLAGRRATPPEGPAFGWARRLINQILGRNRASDRSRQGDHQQTREDPHDKKSQQSNHPDRQPERHQADSDARLHQPLTPWRADRAEPGRRGPGTSQPSHQQARGYGCQNRSDQPHRRSTLPSRTSASRVPGGSTRSIRSTTASGGKPPVHWSRPPRRSRANMG